MTKKITAALLLVIGTSSLHAATTGSVTLSGLVPKVVSIAVTPVAPYNTLDLTTTQANLPVANVQEQSNDTDGYTVTVSSLNAGLLKNGVVDSLVYTAKYNAVSFALTVAPVTVTSVGSSVSIVDVTKSLTIGYTGVPSVSLMNGSYSDTITLSIVAN